MARIKANGIEFEYDEMGPADGEPIVLVMGFTAQMTKWPEAFRKGLVAAGYRVIRFDNRDIGLSHQFDDHGLPDIPAITQAVVSGQDASGLAPYTLNDMAADVAALIDALDAKPAHVLGASMGGMIVQLLAISHPEHVRSMIPVMTTSGDPALPPSTPKAREALTMQPESPSREDVVKLGVYVQGEIGSDRSIADTDEERAISVGASYDRAYRPMGTMRQYAAILTQPRWHENLSNVKAPTMVLHGEVDPLITVAGGQDIVDRIDGAKLVVIPKWGHDVPKSVVPELVSQVTEFLAGV